MTQLSLPGPITCEDLGAGRWRLVVVAGAGHAAAATEIYLRVRVPGASEVLLEAGIVRLDLDWRAGGVTVAVSGRQGTRCLEGESAIVHQPKLELYQALSPAVFDRRARRFWWRIFALMRLPGGRLLLSVIARSRR